MIFCVGESDDDPIIYWPEFFRQNSSIETNAARALALASALNQVIHFIEYVNENGLVETAESWMQHMREYHHLPQEAKDMGVDEQQYLDSCIGSMFIAFTEIMSAIHTSIIQSIGQAHRDTDPETDDQVLDIEGVGRVVKIPKHFVSFHAFLEKAMKEFGDEGMMLKEMCDKIGDN